MANSVMKKGERIYFFTVSRGKDLTKKIQVKEQDLKPQHKQMLLDQITQDFNDLPQDVQVRFMNMLIDGMRTAYSEKPPEKMYDALGNVVTKSIIEDKIREEDNDNLKKLAKPDQSPVPLQVSYDPKTGKPRSHED